jgi:dipeptidyl aminopeptidase/acylaminoacyl peptidase
VKSLSLPRWMLVPALAVLAFTMAVPLMATAAEEPPEPEVAPIAVARVLALGPLPLSTALLDDAEKGEELRRAAIAQVGARGLPREGGAVVAFGQRLEWRSQSPAAQGEDDELWLWAFHLEAERFVHGYLHPKGLREAHLFHNGRAVAAGDDGHELALRNGTHTLWLLHRGREGEEPAELAWRGKGEHDRVEATIEPSRRVSAELLTNAEVVTAVAISSDGSHLALAFDARDDAADSDLRRLEIRNLEGNRILHQWTAHRPTAVAWSPDGRLLATQQGDDLWLHELATGRARRLLANHEHVGAWRWHPDSASILFAWTQPFEDEEPKVRRLRALEDRWKTFRDNSQLFQVDVGSALVRPLTAGKTTVTLHDVHPAGDRLLASERVIDYAEPPHSLFRIYEIALPDLEEREIGRYRLFGDIRFAEQGYWMLAGPRLPQGDGATTADDLTPNEYDTQLYHLAADGATARSVSRGFDPAFAGIHRLRDGNLLLPVVDGELTSLVRFDRRTERFTALDTGLEVMEAFTASEARRPVVALYGTDADRPQRVHLLDLERNRHRVLIDSLASEYADVRLGKVEPFSFTNGAGEPIEGRYYLPPDFDPEQRYPLIVYYYGGTVPVNRQFTGRYPFHLWAAHGYVVYVLQPRGTIGYGQAFSALHVNAWGRHTADDILEGVDRFLAAHDFVDGERMGSIGASYGGFMTMYLATRTDRFAASVSHAGISALTSYWGQGWWGYAYSGIASRGSFPWNDQELYVGQSPVYHADRITTPLLLLTGDADTNVPRGESHNMYTALKLLGREVELVEVPGQDHHILDREKRYAWWDTMLAWFDLHLKGEPEWWHHLYPETAEDG